MAIDVESRIVRSSKPISAPIGDEIALADIETEKYYAFNAVATEVWNIIEHEIHVQDLCERLAEKYQISYEQSKADVLPFLQRLHDKGLIMIIT